MAKMDIKEIPPVPVKPEIKVILELNLDEAVVITRLCGSITGCGETRDTTEGIFNLMIENKRIRDLVYKMVMKGRVAVLSSFNVGHCAIPKE
jgi:hypothetical protein